MLHWFTYNTSFRIVISYYLCVINIYKHFIMVLKNKQHDSSFNKFICRDDMVEKSLFSFIV